MPSFISTLPPIDVDHEIIIDEWYRNRLRALQSLDDNVESIVLKLDSLGLLNNTYIIYTSDHGFHLGQHRMVMGKREPYEEDIRVPFIMTGPGISKNSSVSINGNNIDIAPTICEIAGIEIPDTVDGKSILPFIVSSPTNNISQHDPSSFRPVMLVEHWGPSYEPSYGAYPQPSPIFQNNTWQGLRLLNSTIDILYTSWCVSKNEIYNLTTDPYQLNNIFDENNTDLVKYLDSTLREYFQCQNISCRVLPEINLSSYQQNAKSPLTICFNNHNDDPTSSSSSAAELPSNEQIRNEVIIGGVMILGLVGMIFVIVRFFLRRRRTTKRFVELTANDNLMQEDDL
eukprot:TRINITY_DN10133_c0_g1_i1.p1 TRINITY_DN10133_c0_g1~~TRINITY_DN10133_c0_g1_i1.p1  ORF type:complete len:375 (+),score=78.31 TRINITY_DN10133_c0_g1_i1:102-1127(+)